MRVLRIFHAGRNKAHRARDRSLTEAGIEMMLAVPRHWPEPGSESSLSPEPFPIVEYDVRRPGDVNRHSWTDPDLIVELARQHRADLVDLCEEPFSLVASQLLPRLPAHLPVVMYSAQNLAKRWPPPFHQYERRSFRRVQAFYPCSHQAGSVLRWKGFDGHIEPLPLGYDEGIFRPGVESPRLTLALVGRMVPEKGVLDAVEVLAGLRTAHGLDVELVLAGDGPSAGDALQRAKELGVGDAVEHRAWSDAEGLAELYRSAAVVLAPSRSTATWVEQFGRMIVEAQSSGAVVAGYASGSIEEVGGPPAVLVPEGDVAGLTKAIARVLQDPTELDRLRGAGLELCRSRTWSAVGADQAAFYRAAAEMRPGGISVAAPSARHRAAIAEFGPPAEALGQVRPFALPVLRRPHPLTRALGSALDIGAEARARAGSRRRQPPSARR